MPLDGRITILNGKIVGTNMLPDRNRPSAQTVARFAELLAQEKKNLESRN